MGSRQRKRAAIRKMHEAERAEIAASATPWMTKRDLEYRRRNQVDTAPTSKPGWVLDIEAGGHQYIKGDRAPVMAQTRKQKTENARIRKARPVRSVSVREGNGHPVRDSESPTKGVEFVRGSDWKRVEHG